MTFHPYNTTDAFEATISVATEQTPRRSIPFVVSDASTSGRFCLGVDMREIALVNKEEVALVDDEDFDWLVEYRWYLSQDDGVKYTFRNQRIAGQSYSYRMHRMIMKAPKDLIVHHKNGDGLDNRKENLVVCSQGWHRRLSKGKGRMWKGISYRKRTGRWRARIWHEGKQLELGYHDTRKNAAIAYDKAALDLFGSDVHRNYPT